MQECDDQGVEMAEWGQNPVTWETQMFRGRLVHGRPHFTFSEALFPHLSAYKSAGLSAVNLPVEGAQRTDGMPRYSEELKAKVVRR